MDAANDGRSRGFVANDVLKIENFVAYGTSEGWKIVANTIQKLKNFVAKPMIIKP